VSLRLHPHGDALCSCKPQVSSWQQRVQLRANLCERAAREQRSGKDEVVAFADLCCCKVCALPVPADAAVLTLQDGTANDSMHSLDRSTAQVGFMAEKHNSSAGASVVLAG
jgi:hypothetical protein